MIMTNLHVCLVCLGSNSDPLVHLKNAHLALLRLFDKVEMGISVLTKAEGDIKQHDYWNQAARFITPLSADEVIAFLKQIEKDNGRTSADKSKGCVPLDIDLLMYDDQILKPQDLEKSYVKQTIHNLPPNHLSFT